MRLTQFQKWKRWKITTFYLISVIIVFPTTFYALSYYTDIIVFEKYGHLLSNRVVWFVDTDDKVVAFTFDDGPDETYTPQLLDLLARKQLKATFFLIGRHVEKFPEIVKRIHAEGHEIGNHSFSHPFLPLYSKSYIKRELESTSDLIEEIGGAKPAFFRPPMGLFTPSMLNAISESGMTAVVGAVYPRDPYNPGTKKIVERVLSRIKPGSIIILHDSGTWGMIDRSQTIAAVTILIDRLRDQGYRFLTVGELIGLNGSALDSDL